MKALLVAAACVVSTMAFAGDKTGPAKWSDGEKAQKAEARAERAEEAGRKARMMAVVGIADALELGEGDALKLSEKLRAFEERRKPVREAMADSVRSLKSAAEGDATAQARVDQDVLRLLDGRAQMAAIDKELFAQISAGQSPQKKAKLALFMAKFGEEMRHMKGNHKGRRAH